LVNNELQVRAGSCNLEDNEISFNIQVPDIMDPKLSGDVFCNELELSKLARQMNFPAVNEGTLAFSSNFEWQPGKLKSQINLKSDDVVFSSQDLHDVQARMIVNNDSLLIEKFTTDYYGYQVGSLIRRF
jgi:hypothetical protein